MHSIITIVDVKIYSIEKSKRHTLKYYNMFRITNDSSLTDDGSYVIRNMLEYINVCLLDFCII